MISKKFNKIIVFIMIGILIFSALSMFPMFSVKASNIDNKNISQAIIFTPITVTTKYTITFVETGLPNSTYWTVTFNILSTLCILLSSTTNTNTINMTNGTYSYSVGSISGYYNTPSYGSVTVNGTNVNVPIIFTPITVTTKYTITFTESGLPSGTTWYVNLTNGQTLSSSTNNITCSEPNGSYAYNVGSVLGYIGSPLFGNVLVNGAPVSVSITFLLVTTYTVTFTENGLPSGTIWYVNLSNGQSIFSTTNIITFSEPNGSYAYYIGSISSGYTATPASGNVLVNGANVNVAITFTSITVTTKYTIRFTETGLPAGTYWTVTLNILSTLCILLSSTTNTNTINMTNGTYSYSVGSVSGYATNVTTGTLTVNGNNINVNVQFTSTTKTYQIVITQIGIPLGISWSVTLTGTTFNGQYINTTLSSTTNSITFNEPNGSYTYTILLPSGYQSSTLKGSTTVTGPLTMATIKVQATTNYLLIGIIVILVIIIAALSGIFVIIKKKGGPKEWQEPPKTAEEKK